MPNGKGFRNHNDSKTQPGKPGGWDHSSSNGHLPDFNDKGKITKETNGYHGYGSGAETNMSEKDSQLDHLTARGKKGITVTNFQGTDRLGREHTNNVGTTAYNSRPIDQVYKPATSQGTPSSEQIIYKTNEKRVIKK